MKEKIITSTLYEGQLFLYFYLITIYDGIGFIQLCFSVIGKTLTFLDYMNIWQYLLVAVIGLIVLFTVNGGSKGHNFLQKYFSFSFTVGVKYAILYIILESLPNYISLLSSAYYEIPVNIFVNLLMVANIAFRIYETRLSDFEIRAKYCQESSYENSITYP